MKYGKIMILGAILASCVPSAFATLLFGSISTSGTGTIASTGTYPNDVATSITYANPVTSKTSANFDQSKGGLISADSSIGTFDSLATVYYVAGATDTTKVSGKYVACTALITTHCRNPAGYTFPTGGTTALGVTTYTSPVLPAPIELFTVTEYGNTLIFYLTEIDTTVAGQAKKTGANAHPAIASQLQGRGYVTLNGGDLTYGDYSRIASTPGTGKQAFSATFTADTPEPASIALLGTGMLSAAGLMFRKRRVA